MNPTPAVKVKATTVLYRTLRAAYLTTIVWCVAMTATSICLRHRVREDRPGSIFAYHVAPTVLHISFVLFFVGAAWTASSASARAGDSTVLKCAVYVDFATMVFALLLDLRFL